MTREDSQRAARPRGLRALWRSRPSIHSRFVWALLIALDVLPWPRGEDILAGIFAAVALARTSRRRRALEWAAGQRRGSRWRLALGVSAFRGRWVARSALLGIRRPEDLLRHVVIRGDEHLAAHARGAILLGFHLGPPNTDVVLRVAGYRLAWLGNTRHSRCWSRAPWQALLGPAESLTPPDGKPKFWTAYLYRARRILLEGGTILIKADAWKGRELWRIPVPGGVVQIMSGWVTLHRQTCARVLPVMTHMDGRDQVITIHPPLPEPAPSDRHDLAEWREILTAMIQEYARRWPAQCPVPAFPLVGPGGSAAGVPAAEEDADADARFLAPLG